VKKERNTEKKKEHRGHSTLQKGIEIISRREKKGRIRSLLRRRGEVLFHCKKKKEKKRGG